MFHPAVRKPVGKDMMNEGDEEHHAAEAFFNSGLLRNLRSVPLSREKIQAAWRVKQTVVPSPGADSAHMRPPLASPILRHKAKPIPVPAISGPWSRLNGRKICS